MDGEVFDEIYLADEREDAKARRESREKENRLLQGFEDQT
jgi:hypothetical protein